MRIEGLSANGENFALHVTELCCPRGAVDEYDNRRRTGSATRNVSGDIGWQGSADSPDKRFELLCGQTDLAKCVGPVNELIENFHPARTRGSEAE